MTGPLSWLTITHLSSFTSDLFRPLTDMEPEARQLALKDIIPQLYNSLKTPGKELVKIYAGRIVRHATECPFEDVSVAFREFLALVERVCLLLFHYYVIMKNQLFKINSYFSWRFYFNVIYFLFFFFSSCFTLCLFVFRFQRLDYFVLFLLLSFGYEDSLFH
jgi:hypothetical protein